MMVSSVKIAVILAASSIVYFIYRAFFNPVSATVLAAAKRQYGAAAGIVAAADAEVDSTVDRIRNFNVKAICATIGVFVASVVLRVTKTESVTKLNEASMDILTSSTKLTKHFLGRGRFQIAAGIANATTELIELLEHGQRSPTDRQGLQNAWHKIEAKLAAFKNAPLSDTKAGIALKSMVMALDFAIGHIAFTNVMRITGFNDRAQTFINNATQLLRRPKSPVDNRTDAELFNVQLLKLRVDDLDELNEIRNPFRPADP